MGPRDHRIHLGRMDSSKSSPQNHSLAKVYFSEPILGTTKGSPGQNVDPSPPESSQRQIWETLPNHSKRCAQPILAKNLAEPRPQNSKRSHEVKNTFLCLSCNNHKFCVRNQTFTNYFLGFGPFWDIWCPKPNIYELFLRFWTLLGYLVSEIQYLRIIF